MRKTILKGSQIQYLRTNHWRTPPTIKIIIEIYPESVRIERVNITGSVGDFGETV